MEIQVSDNDCQLSVHFEADAEQIEAKRKEVLTQFKRAPVPGFRKGIRPPLSTIEYHYRSQINDSLKRAMAEFALHETIFQKEIKPFGNPNFTNLSLLSNKFSCDFSLNRKPTFNLAPYKEMTIPKQPSPQTIEDMTQQMLQELRVQFGTSESYTTEDFVQMSDNVVIDFSAFDGENSLDALRGAGQLLTVGKIGLPGFDDGLLGMKVDETKSFSLTIPPGGLPSLVGKEIRFEVKLSMGSKNTPCPLNEELASRAGQGTYQQLVDAVTAEVSKRHGEASRAAYIKQITARLLADNEIKVPNWLSLSEAQYLAANAKLDWNQMPVLDQEGFLKTAEQNVKLSLILDNIRENEPEAQLSDNEVLDMLKQMVIRSGNGQNPEEELVKMNQSGQLSILVARVRDEQTLDFVLKSSIINPE